MKDNRPCTLLEVEPDKNGKVRIMQKSAYRCLWNEWPGIKLPVSVTLHGRFQYPPLVRNMFIAPRDCIACPVRKKP